MARYSRKTPLPRRLSISCLGVVVFGLIAAIVYAMDSPPFLVWVIGSASTFGFLACLIDAVIVFVRMREGKSTAP